MKIFARTLISGLCAASFGLVACDSDDPKTTTDTSTQADTGTQSDTSTESDSSTSEDSSSSGDTGTAEDTGPAEDTAQGTDAAENDASTGEDMTQPDNGSGSDASAGAGACDNAGDLAVIGNAETNPADKAAACGTSATCLPLALQQKVDEFETCVRDCMLDETRPNFTFEVSEGCTECYVDSVRCTAIECLGQCAANPSSDGCVSCREEKGCTPSFYECSGLPRN